MKNNEDEGGSGKKVFKQGRTILSKTIQLINIKNNSLSKTCSSLIQAASYIKEVDWSSLCWIEKQCEFI